MSGFNVIPAIQARKTGRSTGRAKYRAVMVPNTIKTIWANAVLERVSATGGSGSGSLVIWLANVGASTDDVIAPVAAGVIRAVLVGEIIKVSFRVRIELLNLLHCGSRLFRTLLFVFLFATRRAECRPQGRDKSGAFDNGFQPGSVRAVLRIAFAPEGAHTRYEQRSGRGN